MAYTREQDLALAHQLADAADAITLKRFQALDLIIDTKPDNTPVTDADKATEKALRDLLNQNRPDDAIVGEEFGNTVEGSKATRYWVIDPIDGTKNFMRGVPTWATLIGLVEISSDGSQKVVVGVVSAPALFRRWHASENSGAYVQVNGQSPTRISVSQVSEISDASISYSDFIGWGNRLSQFQSLLGRAWRTRGIGDFWSHMLVAEGAVDVAIEPSLALWDMAALDVIVREAGGRFTNIEGQDGSWGASGMSTNSSLHTAIVGALKNSNGKL